MTSAEITDTSIHLTLDPQIMMENLQLINQLMGNLGTDYSTNLNLIIAACGKTFEANLVFYYKIESGLLNILALSEINTDFSMADIDVHQLFTDVADHSDDGICLVENLSDSTDAAKFPVFRQSKMNTFLGHEVKSNGLAVGSLCMLFSNHFNPSDFDRIKLALLARIIGREESTHEIHKANEKLLKMNQEKDNFISILAHDLRSPFNGFLGLTYLLAEESHQMTPDDLTEIGITLRKSATNIYALLDNLLEWSRLQRGVVSFDPESVALLDIVGKALEPMIEFARSKNIRIMINIADQISVYSDIRMAETVIRNIISNSIKFTRQEGVVELNAHHQQNGMVLISIQDNGTGMSQELCNKLFDINEVVKRSGTDGEPSSGLGLIICKEFVQKNGGGIWIESVENKGTTVHFTLPIAVAGH